MQGVYVSCIFPIYLLILHILQTSVAVGDIQEVRQNALLRQRELHVSLFCNPLGWPSSYVSTVLVQLCTIFAEHVLTVFVTRTTNSP